MQVLCHEHSGSSSLQMHCPTKKSKPHRAGHAWSHANAQEQHSLCNSRARSIQKHPEARLDMFAHKTPRSSQISKALYSAGPPILAACLAVVEYRTSGKASSGRRGLKKRTRSMPPQWQPFPFVLRSVWTMFQPSSSLDM